MGGVVVVVGGGGGSVGHHLPGGFPIFLSDADDLFLF